MEFKEFLITEAVITEEIELLKKRNEKLKAENEKLKKQYNCYACGNCKGKEDYINLEKHHKGLRKQFEKLKQQLKQNQYKRELDYGQGYKAYATEKGVFAE